MSDLKKAEEVGIEPVDEKAQVVARIKDIEESLLFESAEVCSLAMKFGEIPMGASAPPKEWIEEVGEDEAWRRFRYMQAGQMAGKDAPSGVKVATAVLNGLLKSRSDAARPPTIGVSVVNITAEGSPISYPEVKVED